jgi:hypothetical protein
VASSLSKDVQRERARLEAEAEFANAGWDAKAAAMLDPSSPNYVGPGYEDQGKTDAEGRRVLTLVNKDANDKYWAQDAARKAFESTVAPPPSTPDLVSQAAGMAGLNQRPAVSNEQLAGSRGVTGSAFGSVAPRGTMVSAPATPGVYGSTATPEQATADKLKSVNAAGAPGTAGAGALPSPATTPPGTDTSPYTAPGAEAPKVDRTAVNAALAPVNQIGGRLLSEATQNASAGLAEAQLRESTARARSAALGAARSGNRRDRVALEREAIGEGAFLEQEAGRQAAALRAQEELQNRQFRVDTLAKAGELGLNVAAYEVDLSKANLASANSWVSEQFRQLGLDKQLNTQVLLEKMGLAEQRYATDTQAGLQQQQLQEQRFESILGFTRDMAAIQLQYDQLSVEDQNEVDRLLMQKYGIDQQAMVALKQIKESGRFRWDQVLAGMAGGFGMGVTALAGKI